MRGFTLFEAMISIAILAIATSIIIPAGNSMIAAQHSWHASQDMQTLLNTARNIAITRATDITLCPLSGGKCQSDWNQPLAIFEDINANMALDAGEPLHFQLEQKPSGQWLSKRPANSPFIRFSAQGYSLGSATTLVFCHQSRIPSHHKQVILSRQGRVRINNYLTGNGLPDPNLDHLSCSN
ncbi:MAG: GspH/FimT family pseudopilin [Oceanospirillaceae bacterium]|nr:GspH/FimT family pseudopilin [Oceanospirillaceae bacterium]MCP5334573.1 GspH/FimT family pseudopilin [Oceanospirillaceae bacterium]MCP5351393.1 GspH/FimT family pseudopilin [Oceanospirillaceae bacterium]